MESNWDEFLDDVFKIINSLCTSMFYEVRSNVVPSLHSVASYLNKKAGQASDIQVKVKSMIFPQIIALMKDPHYKVRISVCRNLEAICEAFSKDLIEKEVLPNYLYLQQDCELEVQIEAIKAVQCFSKKLEHYTISDKIIPYFFEIIDDPDQASWQNQPRKKQRPAEPRGELRPAPLIGSPWSEEQERNRLLLKSRRG